MEPPDTFEGRVPRKFADRAPRVVDTDDGGQTWMYDGQSLPNTLAGALWRFVTSLNRASVVAPARLVRAAGRRYPSGRFDTVFR